MKTVNSFFSLLLVLLLMLTVTACGKKSDGKDMISTDSNASAVTLKDGEYDASAADYDDDGYRAEVKVVIKDGAVYSVDCDEVHKDGGSKKSHSESGKYNMKQGGAQHEWHEEIALFEKYVAEKGIDAVTVKGNGKTDAVAGCTIAVDKYVQLIKKAIGKAKE